MIEAGTRLGPFTVGRLLGVGGMGEVYRARDERLGRDVAIKVLPTVVALDPERRARFQREARVLATLNHPNVASIYGIEEHAGFWALVLELVEGETLADIVSTRGALSPPETIRIALQLVDALDAAHERGVVHRDLKPANVKLTPAGAIKVLDFGLAKAVQPADESSDQNASPTVTSGGTRDGLIIGTAAYMSPEQARGRPVDKRSDIWAFGCVIYELLTGRRAFAGDSISDVIVAVLQREPEWDSLPASTPPSLVRLLHRCLAKDSTSRLRDIADARESLNEAFSGNAASGVVTAAARPAGRNWLLLLAATGATAAALAVGADRLWTRWSMVPVPSFDSIVRIVATSAHEFGPAISPDGKWIAYLSDARGPTDVWVKFISGGEPVNLTAKLDIVVQSQDYIGGLQISPDGASIAFSGSLPDSPAQPRSWVIPGPLGGTIRPALDSTSQGMTWSPDGSRIAYMRAGGSAGDSVWVADADATNPREILPSQGGLHAHWLRWSQDGRYIYINRGWQNFNTAPTEIYRVPVDGSAAEPVIRTFRRAVYPAPDGQGHGFFYAANPESPELSLRWRDLRTGQDVQLTKGVGEYGAPAVSADGSRLVATLTSVRQQILRLDPSTLPAATSQPLSDPFSGDIDPAWSPDGSHIAFSSMRDGTRNIWTARADLTGATPLTTGTGIDENPSYSPDGSEIAFISDRGGRRAAWIVNASGGPPKVLTDQPVISGLSWSRDGRRLVLSTPGPNGPALAILSRDTGKLEALPVKGAASAPVWSPREDVIAYLEPHVGGTVFCRTIDPNGRPVPLGFPDTPIQAANGLLAWSADGARLASASRPGARGGSLWIIDRTGPEKLRKLIDLPAATYVRGLAWSPDGTALVAGFESRSGDIVLAQKTGRR